MNSILNKSPYVIAEVGQNHQGSVDKAIEYVEVFSSLGADAVKFQKRNNKELFHSSAYEKAYNSENAFGETYGQHREHLELTKEEMKSVKDACDRAGVDFVCTPFDEDSLSFLVEIGTQAIKIASFDLGNLPFINKIAQTQKPVIMSVGGGKMHQIKDSVEQILKWHDNLVLLHCVSEYPCPPERLGLSQISVLQDAYPELVIGSSDHFNGTLSGPIAHMLGARVFEKHVTFNRSDKGTDHSFALEPEGFRKFVRDINRVDAMLPPKSETALGDEQVFVKLGKSIVAKEVISKGEEFTLDNLGGLIFDKNIVPVRETGRFLGKISRHEYKKGDPIIDQ